MNYNSYINTCYSNNWKIPWLFQILSVTLRKISKIMENETYKMRIGNDKREEIFNRLPPNIKDSDVLRLTSKKVLAALLELLLHSKAKETGIIFCANERLRQLAGVGATQLLVAIKQLEDYDLITRTQGTVRGTASQYVVDFEAIQKPIIEKNFNDLFKKYLEGVNTSETPIGTTIPMTSLMENINVNKNDNNTNKIINKNTLQEEKEIEQERPTNHKELMDYFVGRLKKECEGKSIDELNEIQESLKDELDEFNEINDYNNIYRYLIIPCIRKKKEGLQGESFVGRSTTWGQNENFNEEALFGGLDDNPSQGAFSSPTWSEDVSTDDRLCEVEAEQPNEEETRTVSTNEEDDLQRLMAKICLEDQLAVTEDPDDLGY